jgi:hypothetical protein
VAAPLHAGQGNTQAAAYSSGVQPEGHPGPTIVASNDAMWAGSAVLSTQAAALIQQLEWKQSKLLAEAVLAAAGGGGVGEKGVVGSGAGTQHRAPLNPTRPTTAAGVTAPSPAHRSLASATSSPAPQLPQQQQPQPLSPEQVAESARQLFSGLMIDLQGAELSFAQLGILTQTEAVAAADDVRATYGRRGSSSAGRYSGKGARASSTEKTGGLIDLRLSVRVRDFPPLNLQF